MIKIEGIGRLALYDLEAFVIKGYQDRKVLNNIPDSNEISNGFVLHDITKKIGIVAIQEGN